MKNKPRRNYKREGTELAELFDIYREGLFSELAKNNFDMTCPKNQKFFIYHIRETAKLEFLIKFFKLNPKQWRNKWKKNTKSKRVNTKKKNDLN